jgi:hypothetical protein
VVNNARENSSWVIGKLKNLTIFWSNWLFMNKNITDTVNVAGEGVVFIERS